MSYVPAFAAGVVALVLMAGCGAGSSSSTGTVLRTTPVAAGPGIAARGHRLYEEDGCAGCHSLDGTRLTGPSWKGLAGSRVQLADGRTVTATNAYLKEHILHPDSLTVKGYPGEVMAAAIEELHLSKHPKDVAALVAFIDSLHG